jgi:hypothetical protein
VKVGCTFCWSAGEYHCVVKWGVGVDWIVSKIMMTMTMELQNVFNLASGKLGMVREESEYDEADKGKYVQAPAMLIKPKLWECEICIKLFSLLYKKFYRMERAFLS